MIAICFLIVGAQAQQNANPVTAENASVDLENARFAARLQASLIAAANKAEQNLQEKAEKVGDLANTIRAGQAQSQQVRDVIAATIGQKKANSVQKHPLAVASALSRLSQAAKDVQGRVHMLSTQLAKASPNQTLELLGTGINANTLVAIFPENNPPTQAVAATSQRRQPASQLTNVVDLYARTGVFSTGGPTVDFPNVALLLMIDTRSGNFLPLCTATLISPGRLITAAHCFCPVPESGLSTGAACEQERAALQDDVGRFKIFFQQAGIFDVESYSVNPTFTLGTLPTGRMVDVGDIALLTLVQTNIEIGYASLVRPDMHPNTTRIVGYGGGFAPASQDIASVGQNPSPAGLKLWSTADLSSCSNPFVAPQNLCWNSGPDIESSSGAICPGDSGGPMFVGTMSPPVDASEQIAGVNSASTSRDCTVHNQQADSNLDDDGNKSFVSNLISGEPIITPKIFTFAHEPIDLLDDKGVKPYSIFIDHAVRSVVITVNGFERSALQLEVRDKVGQLACLPQGGVSNKLPSLSSCTVVSPHLGDSYNIIVHGSSQAALQLLATGYAQ